MSDKSYVSMERKICTICCEQYDTGDLLIDMRLQQSLEKFTTTGWGLCRECKRLNDEGYIALIECDGEKSGRPTEGMRLNPGQVVRTGVVARLKRDIFSAAFNIPAPANPCVFVEMGVIEKLQGRLN